jgi:cytoskeletal protein RodZ
MSCEDIKNLLDEYITDELTSDDRALVDEHLTRCSACRAELTALRAQKAELAALAKPLPDSFEEALASKIKRHKLFGYITTLGTAAVAAVVLVCVVSLSHTKDYNERIRVKLNDTQTVNEVDETKSQTATENNGEPYTEEIADNADTAENKSQPVTTAVKPEAPSAEQPKSEQTEPVEDTISTDTESIKNTADNSAPATDNNEYDTALNDATAEDAVPEAAEDTAQQTYSASAMARGISTADIIITVTDPVSTVTELLDSLDEVEITLSDETSLTAEVDNLSYDSLKSALHKLDVVDEEITVDSSALSYTIIIKSKK